MPVSRHRARTKRRKIDPRLPVSERVHNETGFRKNTPPTLLRFDLRLSQCIGSLTSNEVIKSGFRFIAGKPLPPFPGRLGFVYEPRANVGVVRITVIPRSGRHLNFTKITSRLAKPTIDSVALGGTQSANRFQRLTSFPTEFP